MLNNCLILHPLENIRDIMKHTGLVRYLYETHVGTVVYFVTEHFEKTLKKHFCDLEDLVFEVLPDFSSQSIFKLIMGKYKNDKTRMFFGMFDKFRLDSNKNKCKTHEQETYEPYKLYGFDENIEYSHFQTNCCPEDDANLLKIIKSVANWDYRVFSNGENIPLKYKRNSVIALHADKVFKDNNFFDSVVLIEKTKFVHFTDEDDFGRFVYMLWKSNKYGYLFEKTKLFMFHKGDEPKLKDCPETWNVIKYNPE
jgi:hypothetical protein